MYKITKQFDFCYGHRVWSQVLNPEFSLETKPKCRHKHGHEGKILISLSSKELENGMVTDFKNLGWFKKWLDDTLDHKFIMDINDPLRKDEFPFLNNFDDRNNILIPDANSGCQTIDLNLFPNISPALKEVYEGMVFVDFIPTSENLCKWLYDIVSQKMQQINVTVSSVTLYETPKSKSVYKN